MAPRVKDKFIDVSDDGCGLIATAPYNFVPLPTDICVPKGWKNIDFEVCDPDDESNKKKSKEKIEELYNTYVQYVHDHGKHSGYIEVDITTRTSTLIGEYDEDTKDSAGNSTSSFFSIQKKKPVIPGSSLRGMVRNLFKTVTASSFRVGEDFTDKTLYYRNFAAAKDTPAVRAKEAYVTSMQIEENESRRRGFLVRIREAKGVQWRMYECAPVSNDTYVTLAPTKKVDWGKFKSNKTVEVIISCIKQPKEKNKIKRLDKREGQLDNKKNRVNNKYSFKWCKGKEYIVPESVVEAYREDTKRKGLNVLLGKGDLNEYEVALKGHKVAELTKISNADLITPCFFTVDPITNYVDHFGAQLYYRIPYKKSIKEHVPNTLNTNRVDYTDLVFGLKEYWGGRVSFEDAKMSAEFLEEDEYLDTTLQSVALLGPNPTSFQLYLNQDNDNQCLHWNDEVDIRGVKHYWHRKEGHNEGTDKVTTKCKNRVKPGVTFKGKVYFKSLTNEELGALCKVLFMGTGNHGGEFGTRNANRQFKIGKGKSIGWGSVSITSKLFLEREDSYAKDGMWSADGIVPLYREIPLEGKEKSVDDWIAAFDCYAKEAMKTQPKFSEEVMNALYIMMNPDALGENSIQKTTMMTIPKPKKKTFGKDKSKQSVKEDRRLVDRISLLSVEDFINSSLEGQLPEKTE